MPMAKQADETSIHRTSTLGKGTNTISAMDSFRDISNRADDPQRAPSVLDTFEYGMPLT